MNKTVHLGFEVGTGAAVEIPIDRHLVICGQTQQSGKTTTLDAIVRRSEVRALAFLTKRGEGGFSSGTTIPPYFRERADWQFVSAILEAAIGEKMRFERAWIMRACRRGGRRTRTLGEVQENVRVLEQKAKGGMSTDMYMVLGEYLDIVVPQIAKLPTSTKVIIEPGVNLVDLIGLPVQVQALVIASMLAWVHDHEEGVVCVVPESWKFIPQGRNSPVRMAAIALAREGAGIGNRLWIDSQDIAGAEKEVVRQATVWLLGVQREANEIKRTLAHIPAGIKKPRAEDIALLQRGQFFACWDTRAVKTYVQPAWMPKGEAWAIAGGGPQITPSSRRTPMVSEEHGATVYTDNKPLNEDDVTEDDDMTKGQEDKLDRLLDRQGEILDSIRSALKETGPQRRLPMPLESGSPPAIEFKGPDEEALYRRFLQRLRDEDPQILVKLVAQRPELRVEIERPVLKLDGATLRGRLSQLVADGFFKTLQNSAGVLAELGRRGGGIGDRANYARELGWLTEKGFLFREADGWITTGQKVVIERP